MKSEIKIGVLVSGGGTNLQSIMDACAAGEINGRVVCVISNVADAFALERARQAGIPAIFLNHRDYAGRRSYDEALVEALKGHEVDLVVMAGFMRIITEVLLDPFPQAVMNIHPSLLPAFPGLYPQRQALEYGAKVSGCTVHFVDAGTDTGPIIAQAAVPVLENDTEEALSARILMEEHRIYPEAVKLFAQGRLTVEGRRVVVAPE
ncbi:phosphoribosylglycinamide formyltransferase [Geomonas sp. RF6]|uniref:phosphoribosylglycinamide formyltransferase n=1 Tax=Geomonas sp. RF6 TaxID=2897342 RepID=UPI001E61EB3B|nr:phosphoribosylglycinamide formyltransferase [Geomonas sp. RF6]UFS70429.1 phosphoribosylglycinamide formyltransferase [Geomonas sp. RF6]